MKLKQKCLSSGGYISHQERRQTMELDMTEAIDKATADAIEDAVCDDLIDMGYGNIPFQWQLIVTFTDEDDDA